MLDASAQPAQRPKDKRYSWLLGIFVQPRVTINKIAVQTNGVWVLPLLVLSLAALASVASSGWLKQIAAQTGQVQLPPDFQYYPPQQQEQFMQAVAATSGPAFVYVLPALARLLTVFVGWLLVGNLLHLVLTMFGGRNTATSTLNLVAWAGLPFALRDLVRTVAMLLSRQLIQAPGLSGFAPLAATKLSQYLFHLLALIDVYLILHILLLGLGARTIGGLSARKAWGGVVITMLILVSLQALVSFGLAQLSTIQVVRPFMF